MNDVKHRPGRGGRTTDGSGVVGDLRVEQDDVDWG